MSLKPIIVPASKKPSNFDGELKIEWQQFFKNLEKNPGNAISDLSSSPTNAEISTALNAVLQVLRNNNFIDS